MKKKERMGFISLFIFLILSAFVLVCLENGFIIHAEENNSVVFTDFYGINNGGSNLNMTTFNSSSIYQPLNTHFATFGSSNTGFINLFDGNVDNGEFEIDKTYTINDLEYNIEDFPYFTIIAGSDANVYIYLLDSTDVYFYYQYWFNYDGIEFNYIRLTVSTSNYQVSSVTGGSVNLSNYQTLVSNHEPIFSNMDTVVSCPSSVSWTGNVGTFVKAVWNSDNHGAKVNYKLYDENGDFNYTNPVLGGGGVSADTIEQGLYLLKGSCIYLENTSFNKGTLHVNALLSDDQKNNSNLAVAIRANCTYSIKSDSASRLTSKRLYYSGGTDDFTGMTSWIFGNYGASDTLTRDINCSLGTLGSYQLSLDNFSNGGKWNCSLSDINSNMFTSNIPSSTFFRSNIAGVASTFDGANSSNFVLDSASIDVGGISFNVGYLPQNKQNTDPYLTNVVYTFDLYVCDLSDENNIVWSDVIYSYTIDMLNGTSSVPTDGTVSYDDLNSVFDGDVPSQYLPSTDLSSGGVSSSSSSSGGNSLVNNDNDTINFNGNGEVARDIVNDLIPSDGVGGFTEQIENTLQANSWMQVVRTTFSFVPTSVFTQISLYIITVLGILAAAFVLRIILDLL